MARKTILIDDLDEKADDNVTTVPYTLGSVGYEIDLGEGHAAELGRLLDQIKRFTDASRTTPSGNGDGTRGGGYDPAVVRAWAQANGIPVSEKGRIPAGLVTQWRQATAGTEGEVSA